MTTPASNKDLLLGTAQWGWTVPRDLAFQLLDAWLASGRRGVDAATNYPINKKPADFRAAEHLLEDYVRTHGLQDLQITMKIGSLDNMRTPEVNLAPSFICMMAEEYQRRFGKNLSVIMIHWDNRSDPGAIRDTLGALASVAKDLGLRPGISGIRFPDVYARLNADFKLNPDIQLKHNILQSDFPRYSAFDPVDHRFYAYGINAGGLKMEGPYPAGSTFLARGGDPETAAAKLRQIRELLPKWNTASVRPPVRTMNHIGLIHAGLQPAFRGLVLGFSNPAQLHETLDFWRNLETYDYSEVWSGLNKLAG